MQDPFQNLIHSLALQPHPEGGYFRETYRGALQLTHLPGQGTRAVSTAILFLLPHGHISALHRIKSDEVWHFYEGSPLCVVELLPDGTRCDHRLGSASEGEQCQAVVRAGSWFGAYVDAPSGWSLVGCTVAPGFDFADFEMAERAALEAQYPQHRDVVRRLTRR